MKKHMMIFALIMISMTVMALGAGKELFEPSELDDSWICPACIYQYHWTVGDPENGVPKGTFFKDVPDDWYCPLCGTKHEHFENISYEHKEVSLQYVLKVNVNSENSSK